MAGVNKVNYGNQVVIDISDSTVSPSTLLEGIKAYGANGDPVTGTLKLAYHITLTPEQYLELTPEERKASDCWYYLKGVKKAGGLFQRPANSGWQLTEDEVTTYNYNSHEIMIAAANGSAYVELQNGWNNVSELPTDYAPGSTLTFSAFFEDTTTWVISPIMMRVRPNGMIDVASEGAHNGNLYFSYNYLRENPETDDAWYYTQASNVPYALVDDEHATSDTAWSSSKIVRELAAVNQNIATAIAGIQGQRFSRTISVNITNAFGSWYESEAVIVDLGGDYRDKRVEWSFVGTNYDCVPIGTVSANGFILYLLRPTAQNGVTGKLYLRVFNE